MLNSHGRKAKVEQSLKTTPAALLCVAVMQGNVFRCDVSFADPCMRLLNALAVFDATAFSVHYDWTENNVSFCLEVPEARNDGCPLHIMRRGKNSAARLTFPLLARFQYVCHLLSGSSLPPPFASFIPGGTLNINPYESRVQHVRLHLPQS